VTPEVKRQWLDTLARLRHERATYAKRAADRRRDATECRKTKRWLDALIAGGRAGEYRAVRDQLDAEIKRIRQQTGL
jgi:hypothetical protein